MPTTCHTGQKVFTRAELRQDRLPPEMVSGQSCLICGKKFSGRRDAVANTGIPRFKLYAHPECAPLFRLVHHNEYGSC